MFAKIPRNSGARFMKKLIYLIIASAGALSASASANAHANANASIAHTDKAAVAQAQYALGTAYHVDSVWATAYQVTVTLTNSGQVATTSWSATFTLPQGYTLAPQSQTGGSFKVVGQNVTVTNLTTNGAIAAGGTTTFTLLIDMPRSGATTINSLEASANAPSAPPLSPPAAPTLSPISSPTARGYSVAWTSVTTATSYLLQQDSTTSFSNPTNIVQGNLLSYTFASQPAGTYYYRVSASNAAGMSAYSAVQSVTVAAPVTPPVTPPSATIEHSAWYIDWTSWFTGPPFVIPTGTNVINIFVGRLDIGADGKPTLDGFGNFTLAQIDAFTAYCAAQTPPIAVKVSIGGSGGMYDNCWNLLTPANVPAFAQGMADFCHAHKLAGVDFDYEAYVSSDQEALVGTLIKEFKAIDPNFKTSLCTNAGFGPNYPWQAVVKTILDAATSAPNNCAVDMLYIMSYYDPMQDEINWIVGPDGHGGWANWLIQNYGFTPARVGVGIDDFDAHAYDPIAFAAWAASMGFSTAHWAFNPASP
jgi:hypothetical protein